MKELDARGLARSATKTLSFKVFLAFLILLLVVYFLNFGYVMIIMMYAISYVIFTASWDLIYSYSGQLTLGHALPFGLGAFFTLIFNSSYNMPIALSFILGCAVATAISGAVGTTTIRLAPGYQGIAMLLFSQVLYWIMHILYSEEGISVFSLSSISEGTLYVTGIGIFILCSLAITFYLQYSKNRIRFLAIKGDYLAAQASGINVARYKSLMFFISSGFASIGGAYLALFTSHVDYSIFAVSNSFLPIGMSILGGIGVFGGAIIGSTMIATMIRVLPLWYSIATTDLVYGLAIVVILRIKPDGLMSLAYKKVRGGILKTRLK